MTDNMIEHKWICQAFQHGRHDCAEGPVACATEAEAVAYAKDWANDIPYNANTQHEMIIFRAVASYRGRPNTPVRHSIKAEGLPE